MIKLSGSMFIKSLTCIYGVKVLLVSVCVFASQVIV